MKIASNCRGHIHFKDYFKLSFLVMVRMCPLKFMCWKLNPSETVSRGGTFKRGLGDGITPGVGSGSKDEFDPLLSRSLSLVCHNRAERPSQNLSL